MINLLCREGNREKSLGDYTSLDGDIASFPIVIKKSHEGNLECVAKAQNNSNIEPTVSRTHYLRVVGESVFLHGFLVTAA